MRYVRNRRPTEDRRIDGVVYPGWWTGADCKLYDDGPDDWPDLEDDGPVYAHWNWPKS
jgi:hypothetical protein